jgi:hypothetical protein
MLWMPSAAAPRMSPCSASRLRSRQVILEDRLDAALHEEVRGGEAGEVHLCAGTVGDVDRGGKALQRQGAPEELGRIGRDRRL